MEGCALGGPLVVEVPVVEGGTSFVLPTGTVTFLLTDVEGSTRLWEESADAGPLIARHYELLADAVAAHDGVRPVEQGEGDSIVAAFARASDAVAAALDAQRALTAELPGVRVRMAIHSAEAQLRDGQNYTGHAVIRCARLRACAHGGQVVLSDVAAGLAADALPADAGLRDLGVHRLRDLSRPERVWQLVHPDLPEGFGPLRGLDEYRHNLPLALTPLVGRAGELADLQRLVRAHRIVTVIGAGGVGKTRLAQQVGADVVDSFPGGVWWVDLAPIGDADRVPSATATATGLVEAPGQRVTDELVARLGSSPTLLVVDNCEHVVAAVATLVHRLVNGCPSVHVLATSREPLGLDGEHTWRAPSMAVPTGAVVPVGRLDTYDAVALFVERARQARPNFTVTDANAPAVAQICQRLDGIALAIELAAARIRTLPVERLAMELDRRFRVLTGGARTSMPRQRTLAASVDWSYDLLDDTERQVLRRLGAFAGGFSLDAAESVCADDDLDAYGVLDVLTRLVDKSLVQLDHTTGRYGLLETIRHYALDRATAAGELADIRDRHLRWCVELATTWDRAHRRPSVDDVGEIMADYDNLLLALDWALGSDAATTVLIPLVVCWFHRAMLSDLVRWSDRVLASYEDGSEPWVRAVARLAAVRSAAGDRGFGVDVLERAVAAAERLGDPLTLARILIGSFGARLVLRPLEVGFADFDRALELTEAVEDVPVLLEAAGIAALWAAVFGNVRRAGGYRARLAHVDADDVVNASVVAAADMTIAYFAGRHREVLRLADRHAAGLPPTLRTQAAGLLALSAVCAHEPSRIEMARSLVADEPERGLSQSFAGDVEALAAFERGDHPATVEWCMRLHRGIGAVVPSTSANAAAAVLLCDDVETARTIADETKDRLGEFHVAGRAKCALVDAVSALCAGDDTAVEDHAHRLLGIAAPDGIDQHVVDALEVLAAIAPEGERAVRLAAAAERARTELGYLVAVPPIRRRLDARLADAIAELGDDAARLREEGLALDLTEAVVYARRGRGDRSRPNHGWDSLTPAEVDVVRLVAEGLTNPQIARRLFVETSTVKSHVHHVFTKLGVATRSELAAAAAARRAE